jgi:hypothetical protein
MSQIYPDRKHVKNIFHRNYLFSVSSIRAITRPKIIGPERNANLICNSSLYTQIPKIKSISPSIAKKMVTTKYLAKFQSPNNDVLQINFEIRSA